MQSLEVSALDTTRDTIEVVERKGLGHPDTICDALAETLSQNLCREYRRRFGEIFHHNVDKALLCGGRAKPGFGGGSVLAPITVYLAGRATANVGNEIVKIKDIAIEGSRSWLRRNLHALDAERHVNIHELIEPGSQDLQELFARRNQQDVPLANDTSIGVGFAPMTPLERLVLSVERRINARERDRPAWGEDIKVMGVRHGDTVRLTIACAMIGQYLTGIDDYLVQKIADELSLQHGFTATHAAVNAADNPPAGAIYLTVTGTSAEAGDDGQVGRGNRVNGLISLEAAAGKNPVTHVGKIYNVLARKICETLATTVPEIAAAQCLMVSQIGSPISSPALVQVKIATRDESPVDKLRRRIVEVTDDCVARAPRLIDDFVTGAIDVF